MPKVCIMPNCFNHLHNGDIVLDVKGGYVCTECREDYTRENAAREDYREFLEEYKPTKQIDLWKEFVAWFTEPLETILETEDRV